MSTSKEKVKQEQEVTVTSSKEEVQQRRLEQQQAINNALDGTKNSIRRATDEARKDIPHYTQVVDDSQEQMIEAGREIVDNYVESQRQIINSVQSAWVPLVENAYGVFWNYWTSPRSITELYARAVSSFADNTIAATRLANNTLFVGMEAFKTSIQTARDNSREISRIGVNSSKTFEHVSRDTAPTTTTTSFP
jgi:vacuolar-type H+-ATPase subunit H